MTQKTVTTHDTLLAIRNADGGWGYAPSKVSRVEPTCWSLLAMSRSSGRPIDIEVLLRWKRQDGWFVDVPGAPVNYAFNALAALTLGMDPQGAAHALRIASQLLEVRGMKFAQGKEIRQDNSLQAWSWIDATFSWVEPTAWCLLGLKRLTRVPRPPQILRRIDDGERLLADRACRQGGWNHSNSNMLGTELPPYVPPTAIALLALHDVAGAPHVTRALQYLEANQQAETGALALSLACVCLTVYGRPCEQAHSALDTQWRRSRFLDNLHVTALALYAATAEGHRCEAFRV